MVSMPGTNDVRETVKGFIVDEFLPGEDPNELTDEVGLLTTGILDSISVLKLVSFLEERFQVGFAPHELVREHLNSLSSISRLVELKMMQAREGARNIHEPA